MNKLITRILFLVAFLFSFAVKSQMSDKDKFSDALYEIEDNRYAAALPILMELYEKDKNNANINYSIGLCILNSFNEKEKEGALPYFQVASQSINRNYDYLSPKEKKAPVETWYYLGKAQHNDYQFLEAIESFEKFRSYVNDKHYLYNEIDKSISMSTYAQKAVLNPVNIKTTNLGSQLNGFYPDFSPVVRIDESAIYFTSRRLRKDSSNYKIYDPIDGMLFEDLYVSFNEEGTWSEPMALNINTEGHEATVNLSVDGQTLYIYKDINGNGELYESKLEDDSEGFEIWGEPKKLGSDINSKAYETHVTITPDGRQLYFVSDREGGLGGKDIYVCNLLPTGGWALSRNAGPILNTDHNEDGVFMHPDGKTLYFSSDGHESMGGYDIMYSTITDTGWSKPINMGYPINSVDDDIFFVTTPDGKRAYFSSFKEEGYGEKDVYLLELIDAEETGLTLYRGEFTFVDRNEPPSGAQVSITDNYTGELVGVYTPRQRDGQFSAILAPNNSYHFVYEADAYESYEEDIYVSEAGNYQEIYKEIKLKPVRVGEGLGKITPAPMQFANIKGGLVKRGQPLTGMKILLLNEDESLISQTTSDNTGEFQFAQLNASQTYLIRVISEDGNPLQGYDVEVENDQGEILTFEELDDTTYIFTPSLQPYEFYGIRAKSIAGKVKKNGKPVTGLNVRLEDDQSELIQEEETDEYGEFNFQKLSLDEEYRMVFEGDFPDDPEILITNDLGQEMMFVKEKKGVYRYVPVVDLSKDVFASKATVKGVPLADEKVRLENKENRVLQQTETDKLGDFNFSKLNLDEEYRIIFEGKYPDDYQLLLEDENGIEMTFEKIADGVYLYVPPSKVKYYFLKDDNGAPLASSYVRLEDKNRSLITRFKTDELGKFKFRKLALDEEYWFVLEDTVLDKTELIITDELNNELAFIRETKNEYHYIPPIKDGYLPTASKYKLKSFTMGVEGKPDYKETYPRPEELKDVIAYFQKYFPYNAKDINSSNKEFVAFINGITELVRQRGYADIIITSSASKVPTKTWKTNSILTKKRAYDTKALLERSLKAKGIKEDQYNFVDINTLITGPEYKYDYIENRTTYEKYQYVRVFIK